MAFEYITAKQYPIEHMIIGTDWYEQIPIYQADGVTEWDFSGWEAYAAVKDKLTDEVIIEFDSTASVPTIEFVGGKMYLVADAADTELLTPGQEVWFCKFTDAEGKNRVLILESPFCIEKVFV